MVTDTEHKQASEIARLRNKLEELEHREKLSRMAVEALEGGVCFAAILGRLESLEGLVLSIGRSVDDQSESLVELYRRDSLTRANFDLRTQLQRSRELLGLAQTRIRELAGEDR